MKAVVQPRVQPRTGLAVDFDGVIVKGFRDPTLMDGCTEALRLLDRHYKLCVFTARHDLEAVHLFLVQQELRHLFHEITNRKPQADILDDRAWRFTNWAQALEDLL